MEIWRFVEPLAGWQGVECMAQSGRRCMGPPSFTVFRRLLSILHKVVCYAFIGFKELIPDRVGWPLVGFDSGQAYTRTGPETLPFYGLQKFPLGTNSLPKIPGVVVFWCRGLAGCAAGKGQAL